MQAIFNELSAPQLAIMSEKEAIDTLLNLIQVCKQLQSLDTTFKMRINKHFWAIQLDDIGTIGEYLENAEELNDDRYFLYAVTDSPYLPDEDADIDIDKFLNEPLFGKGVLIGDESGIRTAYAFYPKPAPIISFKVSDWDKLSSIKVKPHLQPEINLLNIGTIEHIYDIHFENIVTHYLETQVANPLSLNINDVLPNKIITNFYLDYFKFYVERDGGKTLNSNIGVTAINQIGGVVAKLNGWARHDSYSRLNGREVFYHVKKKTIFIAIDREKGDFEVHSSEKNDNHLCAISFDGAKKRTS